MAGTESRSGGLIHRLDLLGAGATTWIRGGLGTRVAALGPRPAEPLVLYEFEACPFCRRVREALSILDLPVRVRPCPKGGHRFRDELVQRGGRSQFPYLVDPNTGEEMYESSDIVEYLFSRYGAGPPPRGLRGGVLATLSVVASGLTRGPTGGFVRPSRLPAEPLELYGFEGSAPCRVVRDVLCELELPYLLRNVAPGSPGRGAFVRRSGRMELPWIHDPNHDRSLFGAWPIIAHLRERWSA